METKIRGLPNAYEETGSCFVLFLLPQEGQEQSGNSASRCEEGVHPKAIFHDLYVKKKSGGYSQIDLVVATPQGLVVIEVKDYSGWLFGNARQCYWTQILNYGQEKYRFYNPIMQNAGHIKALKEQSEQIARLPIYNIVLFDGNCTLKDITYSQFGTFVGYVCNIMKVLKTVKGFGDAEYTDKREVARVLREAVRNGENPVVVASHVADVQSRNWDCPRPVVWECSVRKDVYTWHLLPTGCLC